MEESNMENEFEVERESPSNSEELKDGMPHLGQIHTPLDDFITS